MVMLPPEARLTGDEELDEMPMPSWWHGEEAAYLEGQQARAQFSSMRSASAD